MNTFDLIANVIMVVIAMIVLYAALRCIDEWLHRKKERKIRSAHDIIY